MKHSSEEIMSMPGWAESFKKWPDEYEIASSIGANYGAITVLSVAIVIAVVFLYKRFLND